MIIHSKLAPFITAGLLLSSVAARAQTAVAPDPNMAPSTAGEEATLPATSANSPQLSTDPDPDVAPSIAGEEAELPSSPANSPQLATAPNPDLAPSGTGEGTGQ
jgi:hypothetical protein